MVYQPKDTITEGKFKVIQFTLSTPSQPINLVPYCARADIYESILEPTTIAEFIIVDKVGMFSHFNFLEQEICITYTTYPDNDEAKVEYDFKVIDANPTESLPDDKGVVFKLVGVSMEAAKSATIKNIPLVREKSTSEEVVMAMLNLVETKKSFYSEKTKGWNTFALTKITPFEAIDQIRLNAVSDKYNGSAFVFFENSKGFHFKTIEGLIEEGMKNIGDKYFIQSSLAMADVEGNKWRNILAFKAIPTVSATVARLVGGGNNRVNQIDIFSGKLQTYDKKPQNLSFVQLNKGAETASLKTQNELQADEGNVTQHLNYSSTMNVELGDKKNVLPYYLSHFLNTIVQITVYGDSTVAVGDVITCEIPEHDAMTIGEQKPYVKPSDVSAGNFLVTKVRHVLTFNEKSEYMQALELVKDGWGGEAPRARKFGNDAMAGTMA